MNKTESKQQFQYTKQQYVPVYIAWISYDTHPNLMWMKHNGTCKLQFRKISIEQTNILYVGIFLHMIAVGLFINQEVFSDKSYELTGKRMR